MDVDAPILSSIWKHNRLSQLAHKTIHHPSTIVEKAPMSLSHFSKSCQKLKSSTDNFSPERKFHPGEDKDLGELATCFVPPVLNSN